MFTKYGNPGFLILVLLFTNCMRRSHHCYRDTHCKGKRICVKGRCTAASGRQLSDADASGFKKKVLAVIREQEKLKSQGKLKVKESCNWRDIEVNNQLYQRGVVPLHRNRVDFPFPAFPWKSEVKTIFKGVRITAPLLYFKKNLYFGDHRGEFHALNHKYKKLWNQKTGGKIWNRGLIASDAKTLFVGSDSDYFYALDLNTGKVLWKKKIFNCKPGRGANPEKVKCDLDSAPVFAPDGNIVAGGKGVFKISTEGRLIWKVSFTSHVRSSPGIDQAGNIYVATLGGEIISLTANGKIRWSYRTSGQCDSTPLLTSDCAIVVGCDDNSLYKLQAGDGKLVWRLLGGGDFRGGGAESEDGTIYWGNLNKYLYAVNPQGKIKWRYKTGGRILINPLVDNKGNILVVPEEKRFYLLDPAGNLLYSHKVVSISDTGPIFTKPATMVVATEKGQIIEINSTNRASTE
ncbi:MAG: PQQ-binding-like beta-propeller repeat protein [Deltaproteobacteria bacterium]|nr:PQQ-binding-like beta-propeller repeat protein [Deltaproteobacteria bacterium]